MHSREPNTPEWIISTSVLICTLPPTFLWCALPASSELLIQCNKFSKMRDEFSSLNISHKTSPSTIWSPILAGSTILWKLIWLNHGRKHKTNQKTNKKPLEFQNQIGHKCVRVQSNMWCQEYVFDLLRGGGVTGWTNSCCILEVSAIQHCFRLLLVRWYPLIYLTYLYNPCPVVFPHDCLKCIWICHVLWMINLD